MGRYGTGQSGREGEREQDEWGKGKATRGEERRVGAEGEVRATHDVGVGHVRQSEPMVETKSSSQRPSVPMSRSPPEGGMGTVEQCG